MSPIIALIIANIIWGAAAPIFKYSLQNIPPFTLAFIRFFFASLIFLPFVMNFQWRKITVKYWFEILLATFFGLSLNISLFFLAIEKTDSINAPIIGSSGPVFLFIMSVLFLKEKFKPRVFCGMMISLLGVLLTIFAPILFEGKSPSSATEVEGNLLLIAATIASVLMPLFLKNVLRKIPPFPVTFITFFLASLTFAPFMTQELQHWSFMQLTIQGWVGIIFGVFFSSALAYFLYYYGMSKILTEEVGIFTYIDPIVALLVAGPLLNEHPHPSFAIGALLVFSGIFISEGRIHYHPVQRIFQRTKRKR